jgi:MtrB/PioB family decaheme-associated outer membrane protein
METRRAGVAGSASVALAAALLLITPSPAPAETDLGRAVATGEVEVGGRTITGDFGSSKYEEYREQRPGVFGNAKVLVEGKEGKYFLDGSATDIAEDDQHYELRIGRYGRYRLELEYDELPHVFSNRARTLYTDTGNGVLTFPDATQSAIEAAGTTAAKSAALQSALSTAGFVPLRFELKSGRVGFFYRPFADLELNVGYRIQQKEGTRPFAMGFGSPGGNFANVAAPIDEWTHDVTTGIQLARERWSLRLDYTVSFFENDLDTLTVDNPLRATDNATLGSSRGRTDLAPDNSAHTVSLTGAADLPAGFPARVAATVSYGLRFQDEPFVPHTINTTLASNPALALPAGDLDGEVNTLLANLRLTGRPTRKLDLTARYRFFDYNSDIPILAFPAHVVNDASLVSEVGFNTPTDYRKHNAAVDASYRVARPATVKLGVEWERWDRSAHREVTQTDEYIARAAVDYRPAAWALLRTGYRFGVRQGTGYNTFAHLAHAVEPDELAGATPQSQSILLRKFDEANRKLHQADLTAQLTPQESWSLTLTGGYGLADYDDTTLGLKDQESWSAGTDVTYRPLSWLALSTFYTFEHIRSEQTSRWRPRTFTATPFVQDDPRNDWASTSTDLVHTAGVSTDVVIIPNRLDATIAYVFEDAKAKTRAAGAPGFINASGTSTPPDGGNAVDWPDIEDTFQRLIASLRYHIQKNFTVKAEYRFEHFNLANFKTDGLEPFMPNSNVNGSGSVSPSLDVFLGDQIDDYSAHIVALSLLYRF